MVHRLRPLVPDLFIALGLLLLPTALFWQVTLGNRTLLPADNLVAVEPWKGAAADFGVGTPHNKLLDDLILENYPWKRFILESVRDQQLPLWNPYLFAGVPFLAAGQHSALYPLSIIYYLVPLPRAYGVFTVAQLFLAGLFAYVLLRVLGLRRLSAALGAVVYELSLFMVVSAVFPMIIAGAAWLPLILASLELAARQHPALGGRPATLPWVALGGAALGLQVLAGHVEITYYTLLVSGAYALWRLAGIALRAKGVDWQGRAWLLARRAGALFAVAALGLAAGAIQLIPLYELVRHNFRSGSATFDQIIGWAYPWRRLIAFLIPNFFGNPSHHAYFDLFTWRWTRATVNALGQPIDTIEWGIKNFVEGGAYVGLLPMALAAVAVLAWLASWRRRDNARLSFLRNPYIPFFLLLGLGALAFIFPTRLYALIFWLPGIDQLHSPFRWVWPLTLAAAVLAAYGLEYLRRSREAAPLPQPSERRARTLEEAAFASHTSPALRDRLLAPLYLWSSPSLAAVAGGLAFWSGTVVVASLAGARLWYDRLAPVMDRLVFDLAKAETAFADGRMFFSYQARWVLIFGLLLIAAGVVLRVSRCPIYVRGRPIWEPLALAVVALDLLVAGWGFNPAADPALLSYVPPSVKFLQSEDPGLWRFTTFDSRGAKPFNANLGWYFNWHDARGYDSIFTQQYRRYMELIQHQYELEFNRIAPLSDPEALNSPLLDLLNVKYVLTTEPLDNPKYTLLYSGEVDIYRNETALPRAFTLPQSATLAVANFGAAIQQYDPRFYVLVEQASGAPDATRAEPQPADDIVYSPNEVTVNASVPEPAWLVLADSYFPGWKAFLRPLGADQDEERELDIALVNGNFRGVRIPAGSWTVRYKYTPDSVKLGGIISFIAGVSVLFGLGVWAWRYFYQESAVDSTARRVAKNSLAPMGLNLMNRGIDLIFAAFYLRVLGPDDVGKYYFAIVIFSWFEIVTNYGLNTLLTRDVSRDPQHANRYLVNTTLLRLGLGVAAIPGLAIMLGLRQLLPNPLTPDTLWAIGLLVLAQAPASIATGLTALFYVYEKAEYPAAVATVSTILKVALGTIVLVLGWGIVGLAGTSIAVNVITLIILAGLVLRLFLRSPRWELDWGLQRNALRESFPLMLNHLLATLFFKVDVPMLEAIRNQQAAGRGNLEVGWYRTAYQFVDAYNIIPSFFTFALFPIMSRQAKEDRGALRRSYGLAIKLLVAVALPLAAATTFLAPALIGLLGGREYLPFGAIALSIMVWSIPFGWINSVTNYLLVALDQQRDLTRAFGLALAFNVVLNLLLIPKYGYPAAAATTIASEIFEGLAFYWYLRRGLGEVSWVKLLGRLWVSGALMVAVTYGLWSVQPLLALAAGLGIYALGLYRLRAFDDDETAILLGILPSRVRDRLTRGRAAA